ncbi:MAG: 3-phosphoshikimate 1-carboxyvinyltransferase [Bacteroidota bacterium]
MILRWNKHSLNGEPILPASKSISNRFLIIRAVSKKEFAIKNLSDAEDTQNLYYNLQKIQQSKQSLLTIDVGPAGTNMRFLTAFLAFRSGKRYILKGSERMHKRPVAPLVSALRDLGADIEYLEHDGYPPLKIRGVNARKNNVEVDSDTSSQFITALMLIGPDLSEGLEIKLTGEPVSFSYVHMTRKIMEQCGASVTVSNDTISIGNHPYNPQQKYSIEADWSAASYWYAMLALAEEGTLKLSNLHRNSVQGDAILHRWMQPFGIKTTFLDDNAFLKKEPSLSEPVFFKNFLQSPDLAQTFLVLAAAMGIHAKLSGLKTLILKETDRLSAIQNELRKFNIRIRKSNDEIEILPQNFTDRNQELCTYNDHRMAMAMAVLAVKTGEIDIKNPEVVKKSYPHFWKELIRLGFEIIEESS